MRAVRGKVTTSKPISLSRASSTLSKFSSSDVGARRDVVAYLKRTAMAFEDLVDFHCELKLIRKRRELGIKQEEEEEVEVADENKDEEIQQQVEEEEEGEKKKKKKKRKHKDEDETRERKEKKRKTG